MSAVPIFDLYLRADCHLCEDMQEMLLPYQKDGKIRVKRIDIDSSKSLQEKYGLKIPVLVFQGEEICHYYFDQQSFLSVLQKL